MRERETWIPDDRKCRNCGKRFTVLHPTRWAYKRPKGARYEYFCSWGCLRADEKKDERKEAEEVTKPKKTRIRRDKRETLAELIELYEGECKAPVEFLQECGYRNPEDAWHEMKTWSKRNAPDLYEKLADHKLVHPKKEKPDVKLVYDPDIEKVYREEQAEIAMREERGRRIAERLDQADRARKEMIDGIKPLPVAAVYSRTIDGARFKKMDGGMMLTTADYCIRLTAYEWFKLTEEILVAIRQLDATKPEIDN